MEIKTKEDLVNLLTDYQNQITGLQELIDNMNPPVDENNADEVPAEEKTDEPKETEEEIVIDELDQLLNED